MKILRKNPEACIACHACENVCSKLYFKEEDAEKACLRISTELILPKSPSSIGSEEQREVKSSMDSANIQCGVNSLLNEVSFKEADSKPEMTTCTQCGACIDICPVEAIKRDKNGIVRINKKKCVGCFMCVGFCPEHAMFMHDDYIEPFKCISCGQCVKACPTNAIYISEE
ncbi:MAG: 4Fe-4S binding protein [Lutispora sp.]|nr:4Fe-4S binding protein [Lutispora sp.]